jgi:hypothetical protein
VTFGTHMEYPDGSLPSKFNINITKVLMYYMKWPLVHTWSTQTVLFQVSQQNQKKNVSSWKLNIKKTITYDVGNPGPGLEHAQ